MKSKFLVFVLLISFIVLIECKPPQLNVPDELVFLFSPNGTTESDFKKFELTCSGDKPVQWSTEVRSNHLDYKSVHNDSGFYSTIKFNFAFNFLTGYFNCSYVGEEGGESKSTYIYVEDGYSGFVMFYSEPKKVKVHLGDPMILDCRTSRPDIKVNLLINKKQVSRLQYKFDPRVGVIVEDLKGFPNQTQINGIICLNNYSSFDKLTFKPEISLRKPLIVNHKRSVYFVGEEIALNCSTYMNEKYKPHFEWTLPNINAIRELKEFTNKSLSISTLLIKNASYSDSGQYVCKISVLNLFESNVKNIEVKGTIIAQFSEIPSVLPPDKNFNITLFISAFNLNKPEPEVSCYLGSNCSIELGYCALPKIPPQSYKLEKDIGPNNSFKVVLSLRPSSSGRLWCDVDNGIDVGKARTYLNVSDQSAPFLVMVRTENDIVNLTSPGTLETINATEGDNINMACFALDSLYNFAYFNYSVISNMCNTKLSSGRCLNITNISLRKDWFFECIAQTRITNIIEKISFRIDVFEKMAPYVLSNSNVSLEGREIIVKSNFPFFIACYVEGRPKPKITWLKDGENIDEIIENNDEVSLSDDNQILDFKVAKKKYEGKYECSVENRVGHIQPFTNVFIEDEALAHSDTNFGITIVSFTIIVIILFSFVVILVIRNKKNKNMRNDMLQLELFFLREGNVGKLNKQCTIEEQAELLPYDHDFEVKRENITLGKQLGAGAFGRVLLAQVKGLNGKESPTRMAVKMCKFGHDKTHLRALIMELKIMIHLGKHLNIVNLLGAHTLNIDKGELWILVEYCRYGNLLKFIQRGKAQFISQIDPVTSEIDVGRTSPFPNDPLSATSLGCSIEYERTSNSNPDSHHDLHPGSSIEIGQSMGRHPSTTFNTRLTTEKISPTNPTPRKESSISDSDYDFTYYLFMNSDMTVNPQPPSSPASPSMTDSQEKPVSSDSENTPGVSAPLTTTDLLCWAWQVANGMAYLTSRKVLHGDLAARNLLLASNNVVKICDFGLSREMYKNDVYLKKSNEMMPIKWMAPEAIEQRIFSIQSDVWSYGVTLWEMFTLGNTPFPGVPLTQLGPALVKGMRLEKPKYCNDEIYSLLLQCWRSNPVERPRFSQIADTLSDMLSPNKTKSYVNMNAFYKQKNEEWLSRNKDYLDMVLSPDFQNLQSPMSEEAVSLEDPTDSLNTEMYSSFLQSQSRPIVDGGYLDVKFVRKQKPKSTSTLKALSTQSQGPNNVSEKASEEEGKQSLAEASTSIEKSEESSSNRSSIVEQNSPSGDSATVPKI